MAGSFQIANIGQRFVEATSTGAFTDALDLDDAGRLDAEVVTSGAATLTLQFSTTDAFAGEEIEITVDYSEASEVIEQFDPAHQFVRAKVDSNLTGLKLIRRGV